MTTFRVSLFLIVLGGALLGHAQSQILSDDVCRTCVFLFRTFSCFSDEPTLICRLIALKLNFQLNTASPLCNEFPCEGYGRDSTSCTGITRCSTSNVRSNGICPLGQVCCLDD